MLIAPSAPDGSDFDAWWQLARPVVCALLRQRRCPPHDVDDIVQLTAEKAWRTSKVFSGAEHFVAWCCAVALNARVDEWRKTRHEQTVGTIPERVGLDGPDDIALTLVTRSVLLAAIEQLPRAERSAVLGLMQPRDRREATRFAVARHRGRNKLRDLRDGLFAAFGGRAVQGLSDRISRAARTLSPEVAAAAAAILVTAGAVQVGEHRRLPVDEVPNLASVAGGAQGRDFVSRLALTSSGIAASATRSSSQDRPNYAPLASMPIPWIPAADGSSQHIEQRPSTPDNPGQHVCFATIVTPYQCIVTPFKSTDYLFPPWTPPLPG